jgi:hypothetical protein
MCHYPVHRNPNLIEVPTPQLWEWIDCEVLEHINAQKSFTAYSITKRLRAQHPEHEITHQVVQARVHYTMEFVSQYAMTWEMWGSEPARTYAPVCVVPDPAVPFSAFAFRKKKRTQAVRIDWGNHDTV